MGRFSDNKELGLLLLTDLAGGFAYVFGAFAVFYVGDLAYHTDPVLFGIYLIGATIEFATIVRRTRHSSTHQIERHSNIAT